MGVWIPDPDHVASTLDCPPLSSLYTSEGKTSISYDVKKEYTFLKGWGG